MQPARLQRVCCGQYCCHIGRLYGLYLGRAGDCSGHDKGLHDPDNRTISARGFFSYHLGLIGDGAERLIRNLQELPRRIQQSIDMNVAIPTLAKKYHNSPALFFIGRNTDYAVALEGALKMKEISYLHAEAYAAGELKHGTIALIEEHQPVIALCCNPAIMEKTLSNIVEVKSRGAEVLALTFRNNQKILSVADDLLFIPEVDALFSAVIEIVPLQLLAYYVARENGCDIDKPKNLAKSVTVE